MLEAVNSTAGPWENASDCCLLCRHLQTYPRFSFPIGSLALVNWMVY